MHGQHRGPTDAGRSTVSVEGGRGTCRALAHSNALRSRALATTTWGGFPAAAPPPIALAQPHVGRPTAILKRVRPRGEAPREMAADLGRIAVRPGPFVQHPPGMGVARRGKASLATSVSTGSFRGDETESTHELSRVVNTGEVAQCRHEGDGHGELDAASALEGLDHRRKTPGVHRLVAGLCETLETCGVGGDGTDVCLKDHWRRRGGTAHLTQPPEVGGAPGGPAGVPDILPPAHGLPPKRRGLESAARLFTRPAQIPPRVILNRGDVDGRQVTRAPQVGPCDGVSPGGVDPVAWLFGEHRGRDDPADLALWREIAVEPLATRAGVIHQDEGRAVGLPPTAEVIAVTWSRPDVPEGDDLGLMVLGHRRDRDRVVMDIPADVERARWCHG